MQAPWPCGLEGEGLLTTMSIPKQAPQICTKMYARPLRRGMWPVTIVAMVTAGFRWPPDTLAVM